MPGVEVLALGQHVDCWNRLGWRDPLSLTQSTERQSWYARGIGTGSYTPQAVVDGRYELVGSRRGTLAETVVQAARAPRAEVDLARAPPPPPCACGWATCRPAPPPALLGWP